MKRWLASLFIPTALVGPACSESNDAAGGNSNDAGDAATDAAEDTTSEADTNDAGADVTETGPTDAGGENLGLLSLNLHCFIPTGSVYSDDLQRFEAIAQNIVTLGANVVTLQEACVTPSRDAAKDLATRLSELTGKTWHASWQLAHVAWQGTTDEAEEGVALLADRPLADVRATVFAHQVGLTRVALSAEVSFGTRAVRVMSVHLDHQDVTVREEQARETGVAALSDSYPDATTIVAGDFNAKEGSPAHAALIQQGFVDVSDPLPSSRIDHVFVHRGAGLAATQASLVFEGAAAVSDHPGVWVELSSLTPTPISLTRVRLTGAVGSGEFVSIRGSAVPLTWDRGWTLRHDETAGVWDFVTAELAGNFEYKLLKNDTVWQTGANQLGTAGNDHAASASF